MRSPKTTSPSVQYCSRGCVTSPLARGGAGQPGLLSRTGQGQGCTWADPLCQGQRESASFMSTGCSVLHGCAQPLATQVVLGLENISPQVATGQEGKLLLSSQKGNGTAVALPQSCFCVRGSCASFPHVFCEKWKVLWAAALVVGC